MYNYVDLLTVVYKRIMTTQYYTHILRVRNRIVVES